MSPAVKKAKSGATKRRSKWSETEFARDIAQRVLNYRTEAGLTQVELGKKLDMKQSAIARLERGDNPPTIGMLARLSQLDGLVFQLDIEGGSVNIVEG